MGEPSTRAADEVEEWVARLRGSRRGKPCSALPSGEGDSGDAHKTRRLGETDIVKKPTLEPHAESQQNGPPLPRLSRCGKNPVKRSFLPRKEHGVDSSRELMSEVGSCIPKRSTSI